MIKFYCNDGTQVCIRKDSIDLMIMSPKNADGGISYKTLDIKTRTFSFQLTSNKNQISNTYYFDESLLWKIYNEWATE